MPTVTSPSRVFKFESFTLDVRSGELRKHGIKLRLQGQPLNVLAMLLEHSGELVTREELRDSLWSADTFVDFDHSLHNAIGRIREVLGDSAESPRYIETLPRRGYRFIAPAEETPAPRPASSAPPSVPAVAVASKSPLARRLFSVLALLAFCGIGIRTLASFQYRVPAEPSHPLRSIAVLPMQNFSGDPAQEYFSDGMTEALITELSRFQALRVISRTSVMAYKGTNKRLPQIARELGVDGVLEGSVSREGDQVRVTVQLLDAPNDRHLWSDTYQREMRGILTLQSGIAEAIAQQVQIKVTPQQQALLHSSRSVNPAAYESYLHGRTYLWNSSTLQEFQATQRLFQDSIRLDPQFAPAYVGLADSYVNLASFRHLLPEAAYLPARAALEKSLQLDESLGEAHDTLAMLIWRHQGDWVAADREFSRAIALTPNYSCAHSDRANFLSWSGRRAEAQAEIDNSFQLDPTFNLSVAESSARYLLRDFPGMIEVSQKAVVVSPNDWFGHYFLATGYASVGDPSRAIPEFQKAVTLSSGDQDATAGLASAYAATGNKSQARKILHDLEAKSSGEYVSPYMIAAIHASLNEKDQAFKFLLQAQQQKSWDLVWQLRSDWRINSLRPDPRFQSLMRQMAFPQ